MPQPAVWRLVRLVELGNRLPSSREQAQWCQWRSGLRNTLCPEHPIEMWTFVSCNGSLYQPTGELLCTGYSGHGPGVNNPDMQNIEDVGPIPVGLYLLGPLEENHEKLGKDVIALHPFAINQMFGRSGFFIHGDEMEHAGEYLASDGSIGYKSRHLSTRRCA